MKMKKVMALVLTGMLTVGLIGCGISGNSEGKDSGE